MRYILLAIMVLFMYDGRAQQSKKYFYNKGGEEVDSVSSFFYRKGVRGRGAYIDTVFSYYTNGDKLRSKEVYNEDGKLNGIYVEYHENGKIKIKGGYFKGNRVGIFMFWYSNGNPYETFQYPSKAGSISEWSSIDHKTINYWDTLGTQLVKDGYGMCDCYLYLDKKEIVREKGKVVDGLRDSVWTGLSGERIVLREIYKKGVFKEGTRYDDATGEVKYSNFEMEPQPVGGLESLAGFLARNVKYPVYARRAGIQGSVFLQFVVEINGSLSDLKVVRGVHESLDEEALRVIRLMDKNTWVPAMYRGKQVRSIHVMPIKFKLAN